MQLTPQLVVSELKKVTRVKTNSRSAKIVCPFHGDTDPSLNVSLGAKVPVGVWFCFGCKRKGAWNALANKLGLVTVSNGGSTDIGFDRSKLLTASEIEFEEVEQPEDFPFVKLDKEWRGFPRDFLSQFDIRKYWDERLQDYYMWLPMTMLNDYRGYIRAKIAKDSIGVKYLIKTLDLIPYPYDFILPRVGNTLVIVEGVCDALKLIYHRIPTLSILGTSLTPYKIECLKNTGVDNIIVVMDGDEAGEKATFGYETEDGDKIPGMVQTLSKDKFDVSVLRPPDDNDPDEMPGLYRKVLKRMIKNMGGKLLPKNY